MEKGMERQQYAEIPQQSEPEMILKWAVFKHLDLEYFFPWKSNLGYTVGKGLGSLGESSIKEYR